MPVMDGMDACKQLKTLYPDIKILILTMHPENLYAIRLLSAGALGYVTKRISAKELHEAVRTVSQGRVYLSNSSKDQILYQLLQHKGNIVSIEALSDRELQVFYLLAQGRKIKEVAETLCISIKTAENYRSHILYKLNLKRTVDIVAYAHQHKLIQTTET
jgi:DNA-binding NarL/FixJ family response regulator